MTIFWLSPLFGKLTADATLVGEQFYVSKHPITEAPCIIPNHWLIDANSYNPKRHKQDLFGLSA